MAMPKTTVYENDSLVSGENDIRLTGKFLIMKSIAEAP